MNNNKDTLDDNIKEIKTANNIYEMLILLKKVNNYFMKSEFDDEKLLLFKINVFEVLKKMVKNRSYEYILTSCIFELLKKFFFDKKVKTHVNQPKQKKNDINQDNYLNNPDIMKINSESLKNYFELALKILCIEDCLNNKELAVSIVSYLYKNIEEGILININSTKKMVISKPF